MPQDITKGDVNAGNIIFQWSVKEYEEHDRGRRWYWIMGTVGVLLLAYAFLSANYSFALILVLFGIILVLNSLQKPMEVDFAITETGVVLGRKFYRFSELENFWLIYNPPQVKSLYFRLGNLVKHRLQVPLLDYDPRPIRDYLRQFLSEDLEQEEEPLSDRIARLFKLH